MQVPAEMLLDKCTSQIKLQQGTAFFQSGHFSKSLECYIEAQRSDPSCLIAASNGSEAAIRSNDFALAYSLAMTAHHIDPAHVKTWFRIVRSLSLLNQSTKALIFVADLERASTEQRLMLHQAIAEVSPTCTMLHKGILLSRVSSTQYKIITSVKIPVGACLLRETPFLPWTKLELQDDRAMASFVRCPEEHLDRTEGLFPRAAEDMPPDFALFRGLERRVRALLPADADDAAVQRRVMALARCKLCAFEGDLHHFAALIDHCCAPNCEVAPPRPGRPNPPTAAIPGRDTGPRAQIHRPECCIRSPLRQRGPTRQLIGRICWRPAGLFPAVSAVRQAAGQAP